MLLSVRVPEVAEISTGAATVAIVLALAIGIYGHKWLILEKDEITQRRKLAAAVKAMWAARRVLVGLAIVTGVFLDLWFRGKGR